MTLLTATDGSGATGGVGTQLIIIVILILINAFFAASELAILSSNPYKIDALAQNNNKKAILVKKLKENETKFLSTIQVGITLAGFFSSATAAVSLSEGFGAILTKIGLPFGSQIALILVTLILSYFTLVFGELFPKRIALRSPEKIAMAFAKPINVIRILFKPIVFLLSGSCELLVKIFHLRPNEDDKVTEEEIRAIISSGVEDGVIDKNEQNLINAVFTFGDLTIRDVMTPRIRVCMINIDDDVENIKKIIKEEKYTRMPVYKGDYDHIIGILNIKDLIITLKSNFTNSELEAVLRKPLFAMENLKAGILFKKMQKTKNHTAIVVDDLGCVTGFVTMEDLIEEVMGNIDDEFDEPHELVKKINENTYVADGMISLHDLDRELKINLKRENENFSSLAGFIIDNLSIMPEHNLEIEIDNIKFKILEIENNRIKTIQIIINKN